ncbi:MAG: glycoside hydrolase family 9 protein, partial [Draconibacterium sp.]|nr:glycoside hydrolase family 9 protein [Draconibacterium sp.]
TWGWYQDAGDWDGYFSHMHIPTILMLGWEIKPENFRDGDLDIPESGNEIPDILDEAMWGLDLYKRTQGVYEEGGVSWWVESIEHPRGGECSWLNSLPTALVPPTPRACLTYAACAAQMSVAVKKYNSGLAAEYLESALAAMKWVDKNPNTPDVFGRNNAETTKAMALVNLYRATGDTKWAEKLNNIIAKVYPKGIIESVNTSNAEVLLNYLLIEDFNTDEKLIDESKKAMIRLANELINGAEENTYYIFRTKKQPLVRMVLPARTILPVTAAHFITNDKKYSDALCKTIQYTMGANPMNRSYVSGLGERWFIPYQLDFDVTDEPAPSGIPNFGPITQTEDRWGWTGKWAIDMVEEHGLYPNKLLDWPFAEKCFNNCWIAPINEFTERHPMGELIMLTGYLAQISYTSNY